MKISTNFKDIDALIEGLECPLLVAIGGRPGMGKSFFLLNLCLQWDKELIKYKFVSLEMTKDQIYKKMKNKIKIENFLDSRTIHDIDEFCHFVRQNTDTKIFILDYLQLLNTGKYADIYEEVSDIMNRLKRCSLENEVCIIFSSQLSRKVEERQGHRPCFSDFRDSGVIEENCDLILFLLRRDYYDVNDKPGICEVIVAKNRFGNIGILNLNFDRNTGMYDECKNLKKKNFSSENELAFSTFIP